MSTKNLARTVIEGGRTHYSTWARRMSNSQVRAQERCFSTALLNGAEADGAVYPRRRPQWRMFHDKLGPAKRWLESQVGRPWDKARSDMFTRFDIRTTPGRHIVFDHLLPEVEGQQRFRRDFIVDKFGILKKVKRK